MSHACFVARKTHFHFTTQLRFSGTVFAIKTDFSQHTPQLLKTNFGCPLPRQTACANTQRDKVSPAPRPCAHASIAKTLRRKRNLPRRGCSAGKASISRSTWECAGLPLFGARLAGQRSLSLTSLRGAHSLLVPPKPLAPTRPSPCSLSTIQNAPPLFFLQTNPNESVSGLRCNSFFRSPACAAPTRPLPFQTHLRQLVYSLHAFNIAKRAVALFPANEP